MIRQSSIKRIKTADLVIDEVDNFDLPDIRAIGQLVFLYGLYNRKVVISSATPNYYLIEFLFEMYKKGVAFSEEKKVNFFFLSNLKKGNSFFMEKTKKVKTLFKKYSKKLSNSKYHRSEIKDITLDNISEHIKILHDKNHEKNSKGENLSIGLVRVAHIKSALAIYQKLKNSKNIYPIMYHAKIPLFERSYIEYILDKTLERKGNSKLEEKEMFKAIEEEVGDKIIVVIATPVEEVGRDHDFDWGIVEVSSTRSFIQTIGRVNRHRRIEVTDTNIFIMDRNFKIQHNYRDRPVYANPGFEISENMFFLEDSRDINVIGQNLIESNQKYVIAPNDKPEQHSWLSDKESENIIHDLSLYLETFNHFYSNPQAEHIRDFDLENHKTDLFFTNFNEFKEEIKKKTGIVNKISLDLSLSSEKGSKEIHRNKGKLYYGVYISRDKGE